MNHDIFQRDRIQINSKFHYFYYEQTEPGSINPSAVSPYLINF